MKIAILGSTVFAFSESSMTPLICGVATLQNRLYRAGIIPETAMMTAFLFFSDLGVGHPLTRT